MNFIAISPKTMSLRALKAIGNDYLSHGKLLNIQRICYCKRYLKNSFTYISSKRGITKEICNKFF